MFLKLDDRDEASGIEGRLFTDRYINLRAITHLYAKTTRMVRNEELEVWVAYMIHFGEVDSSQQVTESEFQRVLEAIDMWD